MQYAIVDDRRREAFKGGRGTCEGCGGETISKCGPRVVHHWAHHGRRHCDPWWENETPWHRDWKNLFPEECREVVHAAPCGEKHIADIKTPTEIVIEVQHSSITDVERRSREEFYVNMLWIVDGRGFRRNFEIHHRLPDPDTALARDLVWFPATRGRDANSGMFYRRSENPDADGSGLVMVHSLHRIEAQVDELYRGHHQYSWIRPRRTWLDATVPVYLDFGDDLLARLEDYAPCKIPCVRLISKRKLLHDVMVEERATQIASRFYPLHSLES